MKSIFPPALLLLLSIALPAVAQSPDENEGAPELPNRPPPVEPFHVRPGGYLESRNQVYADAPGDPLSLRQRLFLELLARYEAWTVFAAGRFDYDPAFYEWGEEEHALRAELHEAYVGFDSSLLDFFAGKKMVRWGAADRLDPLDLVNPLDVLDPVDDARHEGRLPVFLVQFIGSLHRLTLEGLFIPRAEINQLPEPGNPWEPDLLKKIRDAVEGRTFSWEATEEPDRWFDDSEFGLRASTLWLGTDIDLIYFNGFQDTPVIARHIASLFDVGLQPRYEPFQAVGCSFARGFDYSTLRGEISFKPDYSHTIAVDSPDYSAENDGVVKRDLYQGLLGIDRIVFENVYVNAQAYLDWIEDGFHTLTTRLKNYGAGYEVSAELLDDDLTAGCRGVISASDEGAVSELFTRYRWGDNWIGTIGVIRFDGSASSSLGQYDDNDMMYLTVRRPF